MRSPSRSRERRRARRRTAGSRRARRPGEVREGQTGHGPMMKDEHGEHHRAATSPWSTRETRPSPGRDQFAPSFHGRRGKAVVDLCGEAEVRHHRQRHGMGTTGRSARRHRQELPGRAPPRYTGGGRTQSHPVRQVAEEPPRRAAGCRGRWRTREEGSSARGRRGGGGGPARSAGRSAPEDGGAPRTGLPPLQ